MTYDPELFIQGLIAPFPEDDDDEDYEDDEDYDEDYEYDDYEES